MIHAAFRRAVQPNLVHIQNGVASLVQVVIQLLEVINKKGPTSLMMHIPLKRVPQKPVLIQVQETKNKTGHIIHQVRTQLKVVQLTQEIIQLLEVINKMGLTT